jgi:quercetin dioxygenase-like cupin family protein
MKVRLLLLCFVLCAQIAIAQSTAPVVVPITKEPSHHLAFENEYVRVFKVEVPPHAETLYHKHDVDYVFVTLGDSDVESVRIGEKPVRLQLKDGDTRFTKGGFAHKAVNNSDKPFVNVTVELKKSVGGSSATGLICAGFACTANVVKLESSECVTLSTSTGNVEVPLSKAAKRILIPLDDFYMDGHNLLKRGEVRWAEGPLRLHATEAPFRVAMCEFKPDKRN